MIGRVSPSGLHLPDLGSDPMDVYSSPISAQDTRLGAKLFTMQVRANPDKPGRTLEVVWDTREPLVPGFENNYSYVMRFSEKGNAAGHHFHRKKNEQFRPIVGLFTVLLEKPETKEREEIPLDADAHQALCVPAGIAHTVISGSDVAALLVVATFPNNHADEFPYRIE